MKNYIKISLFITLFSFSNSWSMELRKRARDTDEQKMENEENVEENFESATKKSKPDDFEEQIRQDQVDQLEDKLINQQTGEIIPFFTEKDITTRVEEIRKFGEQIGYPSLYIQKGLIDPELDRINTSNFIILLHGLPAEILEQILVFCMISFFKDALNMLKKSAQANDVELISLLTYSEIGGPIIDNPLSKWKECGPYKNMFLFLDAFPRKNKCRALMEGLFFKQLLSEGIKNALIDFFSFNEGFVAKFLTYIVFSGDLLKDENSRFRKDVLFFARCLADIQVHPNENCYFVQDGKPEKIARIDLTQPFCLLEFAIYIGDYNLTKYLIEKGGDVAKVSKELNCLNNACRNDSVELVEIILEEIFDRTADTFHNSFKKGMIEAIKHKSNCVLAYLIEYIISKRYTALMIQEFIGYGLNINIASPTGRTLLMVAVEYLNFGLVKKLVEDWGSDINATDSNGRSVLHYCCKYNNNANKSLEIAKYLMAKGASCNIKNNKGMNLLHFAARSNNAVLLKYFIDCGLDIDASANDGQTPLGIAMCWGAKYAINTLIEFGANINAKHPNGTPFIWNIIFFIQGIELDEEGSLQIKEFYKFLIEKGANFLESIELGEHEIDIFDAAISKYNLDLSKVLFLLKLCFENESERLSVLERYSDEEDINEYLMKT
jgi:ankyrin repeat protein